MKRILSIGSLHTQKSSIQTLIEEGMNEKKH
jgi:hypothetical protein